MSSKFLPLNDLHANAAASGARQHGKGDKRPDPRDDLSGAEFNQSLEFFARWGFRNLLRESLIQTAKDVISVRQNRHVAPAIHISARWAQTKKGEAAIEFLMPDFPTEVLVARLYSNPEQFLNFLTGIEKNTPEEVHVATNNFVHLGDDQVAHAFGETPEINENERPLSLGASHFDEFPLHESVSNHDEPGHDDPAPGSSWA